MLVGVSPGGLQERVGGLGEQDALAATGGHIRRREKEGRTAGGEGMAVVGGKREVVMARRQRKGTGGWSENGG